MRWFAVFALSFLSVACTPLGATASGVTDPCSSETLPKEVRTRLANKFGGWVIVTPQMLTSADDREFWERNYASECPGMVAGRFTGDHQGFAISLVRGQGSTLEQQIVVLESKGGVLKEWLVNPPSHVDVVAVLRRFGPGDYESPDTGEHIRIGLDTLGVSEIEGGTVVYYWLEGKLKHIVTSL